MIDRHNRIYFIVALAFIVIGWIIFKLIYPSPNLIFDSYFYIKAASLHQNVNAWPIGYSKMMELFNAFSHSSLLFVSIQYFALSGACMYFFFTWRMLFHPGKFASIFLFIVLFANPLLFYSCNYIMADAPFATISLLWITQLLWIVYRPRLYMVFTQAFLLVFAFTIRYNALYFPVISIAAFCFSRISLRYKFIGAGTMAALLTIFIVFTRRETAGITGSPQFSPFGSWKLANNALYMYGHIVEDDRSVFPSEYRKLDSVVKAYFTLLPHVDDVLKPDQTSGSGFMFYFNAPLVQYLNLIDSSREAPFNTRKWMAIAPFYQNYGVYLIRQHPVSFLRYFVLPNSIRYLLPPKENMGTEVSFKISNNLAGPYVYDVFRLKELSTPVSLIQLNDAICRVYPSLFLFLHLSFVFASVMFFAQLRSNVLGFQHILCFCLLGILVLVDFLFSILSAAVVLRYQLFVGIIEVSICVLVADRAFNRSFIKKIF